MTTIALSPSQMKHLQELGLDCSDASMYWLESCGEENLHLVVARQSCASLCEEESYAYTLEDILLKLQQVKYKSVGFPVLFFDYNYSFGKWGLCFRNPYGFSNPNIQELSPLEAAYKMLIWYLERKNNTL